MKYSSKQLADGICSYRELLLLENGERMPGRLVVDAVMERLGIGSEVYEYILDLPDYQRWEDRQRILHAITYEEFNKAEALLAGYFRTYCEDDGLPEEEKEEAERRLEQQFYLSMRTLLTRCMGGGRKELEESCTQALELTVPKASERPLADLALSLKELNLILEAEYYREDGGRPGRYLEVLTYIEAKELDEVAKAKIYPKAVYFLCRETVLCRRATLHKTTPYRETLLRYCAQALEALRRGERLYFLWELLKMRENLLNNPAEREKIAAFRLLLERTYEEFGVPKETFEFCYLHVTREVCCVNDVIRLRREMLELTAKTLCGRDCTARTLCNIENKKTSPQRRLAEKLLERLGLARDRIKTDIVTDDQEARELENRLRDVNNEKKYDEAEEVLDKLKARISEEIPCNRQLLEKQSALIDKGQGKISKEECSVRIRKALEITLPFDAFLKQGKKYLTNLEQTCILNMMAHMDRESKEFLICMERFEEMYQPVIQRGMQETVANMYELVMGSVGSELGNRGEYDRSDEINETIIRGCLRFRRIGDLDGSLYGRWWNHKEREKEGIPTNKRLNRMEELERCIQLARFTERYKDVRFYRRMLEE